MNSAPDASTEELRRRRSLPPGGDHERWPAAGDAWPLRLVRWPAADGMPTILFLGGRADFIEKYTESLWHWRDQGFGIVAFDWRGQGLSGRFAPGTAGYFEFWLADLDAALDMAAAFAGGPVLIAAHSMGGHLTLRHLSARAGDERVRRAVLFAPMAGIRAPVPQAWLHRIARFQTMRGRGDGFPPGHGAYGPRYRSPLRQRLLTGDVDRFADEAWWIDGNPALALDGVNWRWIAEALASCDLLEAPGVPERVSHAIDVFMGANERLVDPSRARGITQRLPHGRWHEVPGGAHELLRETPAIQEVFHAAVDAIIGRGA